MKNHYQTLGLKNNASQDEIKKAYRKFAIKFHPDKNIGDGFFDELFREIKDAYNLLSNPISKREYDLKYNTFLNKLNTRTNETYQQTYSKNQQQETYKPKPKIKYFSKLRSFNLKKIFLKKVMNFSTLTLKEKFVFLFQIFLFILPLLGVYLNGFLGFITVIGFYFFTYIFIDSVKGIKELDLYSGSIGLIVVPYFALLIFVKGLSYFNIHPYTWFENDNKIEKVNEKVVVQPVNDIQEKEELTEKEDKIPMLKVHSYMNAEQREKIRKLNKSTKRINEFSKELKSDEYKKIFDNPDKSPSKYRGNQLKNGTSPLDACFGKGVYSQNAWLKFDNSNKSDAVVCLVRSYDQKTIRNEYIKTGATFKMSKIPSGTYFIKVYYGNDWNPNKKNFCGINGAFERNVSFSKSDKIGDQIKIENTSRSYTTGTITLYAVENGNMTTESIDEEDFFNK